ncbi:hypothetical protein [Nostoc commune]|uniref:hypothetical protein n=1 Tax=Nostoc commune TaxID=1178 RepID=UPI0018C5041F|nr:hypothetical protein [Nostoc commune]MBG1263105.1 hypothetical protein [Nostoc commune BAE]
MFLVQALPLVGGINLKSSISNPQAASLVGAVNLKSTIGNLQLFDLADLVNEYAPLQNIYWCSTSENLGRIHS